MSNRSNKRTISVVAALASSGLVTTVLFNNCSGKSGFYLTPEMEETLSSLSNPNGNENGGGGSNNNQSLILTCVPKTSSKIEAVPKSGFQGKFAESLVASDESGVSQKIGSDGPPDEVVVEADRECLQSLDKGGAISAMIRKNHSIVADLEFAAYRLESATELNRNTWRDDINNDECVRHVDRNAIFELSAIPNDPRYADQANLLTVNFSNVFSRFFNASNGVTTKVRIAVIDSGIDVTHPELSGNLARKADGSVLAYNVFDQTNVVTDSGYHGTHVSGTAAASTNNSLGLAGVAGAKAEIMMIKAFNSNSATLDGIINGIYWAANNGAEVLNMSLGATGTANDTPAFRAAIEYALSKNVTVVVAAGNGNAQGVGYELNSTSVVVPANYSGVYPGVIAVGSTDAASAGANTRSSFSNFSSSIVKIMAPGQNGNVGILSTVPVALTANGSGIASTVSSQSSSGAVTTYPIMGTSMASPLVAGSAALVIGVAKARGFKPTPAIVEKVLLKGSATVASLASQVKDGKRLDLQALINLIDADTGIDSNGTATTGAGNPIIATQPSNVAKVYGESATMSMASSDSGSLLLNYQWKKNGVVMPGKTASTLTISNLNQSDAAIYSVELKSGTKVVNSVDASLKLGPAYCN